MIDRCSTMAIDVEKAGTVAFSERRDARFGGR